MNRNLKIIGLGLLGGMLPLGLTMILNTSPGSSSSADIFDGANFQHAKTVNLTNTENLPDFVSASENTINSVVHVTTKVVRTTIQRDPFYEFFYGPGTGNKEYKQYGSGSGSGVIVSSEGYIVTNNHVIDGASEIEIILNDNSKYSAKVIGTDPSTDLAVLKIDAKNLVPIVLGNSDNLRIGEWVLAVGNPFNLTSTVTAGIVSAKARNINILNNRNSKDNVPIESFIQTDAAVNPGNSGGALVNTKGELVGINTAIASQTGSYTGYSFAIPVNLVQKVMLDLIDFGLVQRGFLGVQIADITQELKEEKNLSSIKGVYVAKVIDDGGAEKAGMKEGEIILKIGSKEITSVAALQEEIGKRRPGDKVPVTVMTTKGNETVREIVLRNSEGKTNLLDKAVISKNTALGATFEEMTSKEKKDLNTTYGVKIKSLNPGKLKSIGFEEGMIITKINQQAVTSVEQLTAELNKGGKGILLEYMTSTGKKDYVGFGL
ncbi:MAG: Do family serine endopeptidase [Crocinitomicaceae bacterium]|nr:Do family serine endopeptidase [Crocinitomicaceae bacterium]